MQNGKEEEEEEEEGYNTLNMFGGKRVKSVGKKYKRILNIWRA